MWTKSSGVGTDKNYQGPYEDGIADDWNNNNMNYAAGPPPCLCYGNHFPVPMPPPVGIPYMQPSFNNMYALPQAPFPYEYFQPNLAYPMYQQQQQQAFSNSDRSDYGDWQQQIDYQTKLKEQQLLLLKKQTMLVEQNLVANQRRNSMMQQHLINRVRSNTAMCRSNSLPVNARSSMSLNRRSSMMTIEDNVRNSTEMVSRVHHLKSMINALKNKINLERSSLIKEKMETESHYRLRHAPNVEGTVLYEPRLEMKESPSRRQVNVATASNDLLPNYGEPPSLERLVRTVDLTTSPLDLRLSATITDVNNLPQPSVAMRQQEEQLKKRSVAVIAQAMSYKNKLAEIERRCNEELNNVQKSLSSLRETTQLRRQGFNRVGNTKSEIVTDAENKRLQTKQAKSNTHSPPTTTQRKKRTSPRNRASAPVRKCGSTAAITCECGADGSLITSAIEDSEAGSKHSINEIRNYSASSESISSSICDRL